MITNQVMVRQMGEFNIQQRTKDGMFNATALVAQWNAQEGAAHKEIKEYLENKTTKEFLEAFNDEENLDGGNSPYVTSKARADRGGGTWMNPIVFIDFAMWLNPKFKVKVLKFAQDQMLKYRDEAGEAYKELSSAVKRIVPPDYLRDTMMKVGEALNWIVWGHHEPMIRNKRGEESEQRELVELERKVTSLINEGFITNYDALHTYLQKQWAKKWNPKVFR